MKNIILVVLTVISLSSCKQIVDYGTDLASADRYRHIPIYYNSFWGMTDEAWIPLWMDAHITYTQSSDLQTPAECVASGYGDCEEFALMYLNIMYVMFGKKGELCLVESGRTVEAGGRDCNHAVVRYGSTIIEPMTGREAHYVVCYSYKFDDIFN
jgi:hypothetical protein